MDSKAILGEALQKENEAFKKVIWVPEAWIAAINWVRVIEDFTQSEPRIVDELYSVFKNYYARQFLKEEPLNLSRERVENLGILN